MASAMGVCQVYVENIDRESVMREANEDAKKTIPIDD